MEARVSANLTISARPKSWPSWRLAAVLTPLVVCALLWTLTVARQGTFTQRADGKGFAEDIAMFVTASQLTKDGSNPFDHSTLYRAEESMLERQGLAIVPHSAMVRVGYPPLFWWALEPLTTLPFQWVAYGWRIVMYLLAALGFLACLRSFGWRRWMVPCLIFLLMPPVIMGAGNIGNLLFTAVGCSLFLSKRHPLVAGALMSLAWLKPPVALPFVLLIALFHVPERRQFATGFIGATGSLLALTLATTGWHSLQSWLGGLTQYANNITIQQEMPSLSGLYIMWAPPLVRVGLTTCLLCSATAVTAIWWRKHRGSEPLSPAGPAWLWFVWFLAIPYVHYGDEVLLTVPLLALLGRDCCWGTRAVPALALNMVFFSPLLIGWTPFKLQLLGLMLVPSAAAAFLAARNAQYRKEALLVAPHLSGGR